MGWPNSLAQSRAVARIEPTVQHMTKVVSGCYSVKRRNQILHVVSGATWVTVDDEDYILNSGQSMLIPRGKYPAVVEVVSKQPLVFSEYDQ